jgi:hypothetical protein
MIEFVSVLVSMALVILEIRHNREDSHSQMEILINRQNGLQERIELISDQISELQKRP